MKKIMITVMIIITVFGMNVSAHAGWFSNLFAPPPKTMTAWEAQKYTDPDPSINVRYANLSKAQIGGVVGGVVVLGGVAIALTFIGSGMTAAEITTALATIGSLIGGGMVAGVIIVAVGTTMATGAGVYGGYKAVKWGVA